MDGIRKGGYIFSSYKIKQEQKKEYQCLKMQGSWCSVAIEWPEPASQTCVEKGLNVQGAGEKELVQKRVASFLIYGKSVLGLTK